MSFPLFTQVGRLLQFVLPDYTSPPFADALLATPVAFRDDATIDAMRATDEAGNCTVSASSSTNMFCQIPFEPDPAVFDLPSSSNSSPLGVILFGGALVDPRGYSVLAERLTDRYGLTVVVPVFADDLQFTFGECNSGRLALAQAAYPDVEQWLFVGHSFGGVAAMSDVWDELQQPTYSGTIAGLVLLASDVQPELCPGTFIDFSDSDLPMAAVIATEDQILNLTRWEENMQYLSKNLTTFVSIEGGNHGQFGSYNDTLRTPLLGQVDGEPTISPETQWDLIVEAIYGVALQSDVELPTRIIQQPMSPTMAPTTSGAAGLYDMTSFAWMCLALAYCSASLMRGT